MLRAQGNPVSQGSGMETILFLCPLLPPGTEAFCSEVTNQGVSGEKQEVHWGMGT